MQRGRLTVSRNTIKRWVGLLVLMLVLSVVSCGGEGGQQGAASGAQTVKAENAEVGTSLEGEVWRVTLLERPEQMKTVQGPIGSTRGAALHLPGFNVDGRSLGEEHVTAKGMYVMVPIELTNISGEPQMMSGTVLQVVDSEAQEYGGTGRLEHTVYVWTNERWMDETHELVPHVFDVGDVREGPVIFDIPEDATGLTLKMKGTDEVIDLGF